MSGALFGQKGRDLLSEKGIIRGPCDLGQPRGTADQVCAPQRKRPLNRVWSQPELSPQKDGSKLILFPSLKGVHSPFLYHTMGQYRNLYLLSVCVTGGRNCWELVLRNNEVPWFPEGACVPVRLPGTSAECLGLHLPCVWSHLLCKGLCTSSTPVSPVPAAHRAGRRESLGFFPTTMAT